MLTLRYAARSDIGLVRRGNEDSGYASSNLLIIADGMGGHAAGELASATVVATLAGLDRGTLTGSTVESAIATANETITEIVAERPELAGMGTTVTALVWRADGAEIVHCGDSRAYQLRGDVLTRITTDHTYVQTLVDSGRISEEEAAVHPRRSLLMRAIDGTPGVPVDVEPLSPQASDRFLVCSDGLTTVVTDDDIRLILGDREPTAAVTALVELALSRGAPDNITVVVAHAIEADATAQVRLDAQLPVVVGAAGEPRVRAQLPQVRFPDDSQPDPNRPDAPPRVPGQPTTEQPILRTPSGWGQSPRPSVRQQRTRRIVRTTLLWIGIAVLLLAIGFLGLRAWWQQQWYVGVSDSQVAIFHGTPGQILGIPMQSTEQVTSTKVSELPTFSAELVGKGITASSLEDAQRIVGDLDRLAQECMSAKPPAGCPQGTP